MLSASKSFRPEDYDLDGLRLMLAFERLEKITTDDLHDWISGSDDADIERLLDALRDADPQTTGIAMVAYLKDYFYELTTDDDAVERARELHQDAHDEAVIARGERE